MNRIALALLLMLTLWVPCLASGASMPDASAYYKAKDVTPVTSESCSITLQLADGVNTISRPGMYRIQGSCTGQLVVDVQGADVYLLLDGISITSPDGPAIHIKAADKVIITLADGTESTLTDSPHYTLPDREDEPNGALFSKEDLSINGAGTLRITAQYDEGIVSKDSLVIAHANIVVNSKGDAIRGKDSVMLYHATVSANAGNDGVKSTNTEDAGRGWIYALSSSLTISAQHDAIQAETDLYFNDGTYRLTSGGGCLPEFRQEIAAPVRKADQAAQPETKGEAETDSESGKGLKAANIHLGEGMYIVNSRDDAIHANGSIVLYGGSFELASNDDGIHADDTFTMHNGHIVITECYEGIEAAHIFLGGGKTDITAIDDGWNAASKTASETTRSKHRRKNHDFDVTVSGGEHHILAGADAIDSNGSILICGGTTLVSSSNEMKEVPIDYPLVCECRITGGILAASGGYGKNTQTFSQTENQACITLKWKEQQSAGTIVTLWIDGQQVLTLAPAAAFKSILVSTPALQVGQKLTVQTGEKQVSTREISENMMLFPVVQSKRTPKAAQKNPDSSIANPQQHETL